MTKPIRLLALLIGSLGLAGCAPVPGQSQFNVEIGTHVKAEEGDADFQAFIRRLNEQRQRGR